MTSPL